MRTVYLSGQRTEVERINRYMVELRGLGFRWFAGHAWTDYTPTEYPPNHPGHADLSMRHLAAAVGADLFVQIVDPGFGSKDTFLELGARLGVGKEAHIIFNGSPSSSFHAHPLCIQHGTWESFIKQIKNDRI